MSGHQRFRHCFHDQFRAGLAGHGIDAALTSCALSEHRLVSRKGSDGDAFPVLELPLVAVRPSITGISTSMSRRSKSCSWANTNHAGVGIQRVGDQPRKKWVVKANHHPTSDVEPTSVPTSTTDQVAGTATPACSVAFGSTDAHPHNANTRAASAAIQRLVVVILRPTSENVSRRRFMPIGPGHSAIRR